MLISKKDLLKETGISYGQLYRWKREGLIPETWFIKQPSFTGQETFFPKTKILNRINAIQELKDKYSLEELSKILSPEVSERNFTIDNLQIIKEIDKGLIPCFCKSFNKDNFSYVEVLVMIALSNCKREFNLQLRNIEDLCMGIQGYLKEVKQTDYMFVLLDKSGDYFVALHAEEAEIFFDKRLEKVYQVRLNDISSMMKLKYRKSFGFEFDEEEATTTELMVDKGAFV